jgi:hypothetical protein
MPRSFRKVKSDTRFFRVPPAVLPLGVEEELAGGRHFGD